MLRIQKKKTCQNEIEMKKRKKTQTYERKWRGNEQGREKI